MEKESFSEILDKLKGYTKHLYFHIKGEPFFHPNLQEFINIAYTKGFNVNLTSNGTLLNEDILDEMGLRQINFSLHSFEEDSSEDKKNYLQNIIAFSKKAEEKGKIISIRLWNLKKDIINEENDRTIEFLRENFTFDMSEKEFQRGKGIKLSNKIYLNYEEVFEWPSLENTYYNPKGFCQGLNTHVGILVDGTVVPCCLDENAIINLGNINDVEKLGDIIENQRSKNMISAFKNRVCVEELCKHCSFKERF